MGDCRSGALSSEDHQDSVVGRDLATLAEWRKDVAPSSGVYTRQSLLYAGQDAFLYTVMRSYCAWRAF